MTLSRISFVDRLEAHAGRPLMVTDDGRVFPYEAVLELADKIADLAGQVVFCFCSNDPGTLIGYLALLRVGAVPAMLSGSLPVDKASALMEAYRPGFLWLPESRLAEFTEARPKARHFGYALADLNGPQGVAPNGELALLLTTSGSTGSPRFVRQSRVNLSANADAIASYLGLTEEERPITTLPLNYTYGLSVLHSHLVRGATLALTAKSFFDRGFWDFFKEAGATSLAGVPYHYEMLKKLRFARMDLPFLRTLTQAGGAMGADLVREFADYCQARGKRLFVMYGQTEATARMSFLPPDRVLAKAGSIGRAIPGGEFWLEDDAGARLDGADAVGELVYRGPNVTLGYAERRADLALGDERCGVLRTGDMARRDQEGDYYIVGRLARFLKLFGIRVNLQEVEAEIRSQGFEVACAGRDDLLKVYLAGRNQERARIIKDHLIKYLNVNAMAVSVVGVEGLPRNETGKILYVDLTGLEGTVLA